MEEQEITLTKTSEEKLNERQQQQLDNLVQQAQREFMSYPLVVPEGVWDRVPKSKRQQALDAFKHDVIGFEIEKARETVVTLNSSKRESKEFELWLNHRNLVRQLHWNMMRLEQLKAGQEVKDEQGKTVHMFELQFLVDKLSKQIGFSLKEAKLFGMNEEEILKEL